jgi:hypothetical protein
MDVSVLGITIGLFPLSFGISRGGNLFSLGKEWSIEAVDVTKGTM